MRIWASTTAILVLAAFVAFFAVPEAEAITLSGYFTDDDGDLFENDIDALAFADITRGCNPPSNTHFCPSVEVDRGVMAAFIRRALDLPSTGTDYFGDDNGSTFEGDINAIAAAGITLGCNPPANTRYCPDARVYRGAMAAFLRRALSLPASGTDYFSDDNDSIFEADINAIAAAGITVGCNPPANTRFCPGDTVKRANMAAFLTRALDLPTPILEIPMGRHSAFTCTKDGERCSLTVDLSAGRVYRVQEGVFQVTPATSEETADFNQSNTTFSMTLNGSTVSLTELAQFSGGGVMSRRWRRDMSFSAGTHTLVGTWRWDGTVIQRNTLTIRASS
ncbi:MAG: hypothetical protein PVG83_08210 [Acidimicrobiia bacterium]|jgi:hypothetical protein